MKGQSQHDREGKRLLCSAPRTLWGGLLTSSSGLMCTRVDNLRERRMAYERSERCRLGRGGTGRDREVTGASDTGETEMVSEMELTSWGCRGVWDVTLLLVPLPMLGKSTLFSNAFCSRTCFFWKAQRNEWMKTASPLNQSPWDHTYIPGDQPCGQGQSSFSLRHSEPSVPYHMPLVSGCWMSRTHKVYKSRGLVSVSFTFPLQPPPPPASPGT